MTDVDVPAVGAMNKKVVVGVGVAAAGFVGWRYYQSRKAAAAAPADTTGTDTTGTDPGFQDPGALPSVAGAGTGSFGLTDPYGGVTNPGTVDGYGFSGTTNAEWSQYAAAQLVQSESWTYTDIVTALGNYLAHRPLSATQQSIVQAAIAVAGYPPVGSFTIVPGGDTGISVAPSGLKVTATTATSASISWEAVAGASGYHVDGATVEADATGTSATLSNLQPNTAYSLRVAAKSTAGTLGPYSASVSAKTAAAPAPGSTSSSSSVTRYGAPTGLRVGATGTTDAQLSWNPVKSGTTTAPSYTVRLRELNGTVLPDRITNSPSEHVTGLHPGWTYQVTVWANGGKYGPPHASALIRTKK